MGKIPSGVSSSGSTSNNGWNLITSYSDTNTTDTFSFDTNTLSTTYDLYWILGIVETLTSSSNILKAIVNNLTSPNYVYTTTRNNDLSYNSGYPGWELGSNTLSMPIMFDVYIRGNIGSYAASPIPLIFGNISSVNQNNNLYRGYYNTSIPNISRIKIYTTNLATGKLQLFGKNIV